MCYQRRSDLVVRDKHQRARSRLRGHLHDRYSSNCSLSEVGDQPGGLKIGDCGDGYAFLMLEHVAGVQQSIGDGDSAR